MDDAQALAELKAADAQLHGGAPQYDDATHQKLLSHYKLYLEARAMLQSMDLTEVRSAQVLAPGDAK
ncbi:MAG: hypothetical protein EXR52_01530 [Dehalococcoidia bacterium]|nr:hypothetical protein [Dehalococcoidia bacterium]